MFAKKIDADQFRKEYGVGMCRLFDHVETQPPNSFGSAIVNIEPLGCVDTHSHHEHEIYFVLSGSGRMVVNEETRDASDCDLFYVPPFQKHSLINTSTVTALRFLAIWWALGGLNESDIR